ncbi:PITH domain-containing protein CG6153 isoform X2 [Eurytemora carolleeae]|uniref:PITH domain-containing protein CG6153 isoform X2 n=1 Tax=Eurytemora carolleeae TaxID=1294199 RepID=UPI000C78B2C5|nr:PITH domain-containing protein CG6153 isoform X2 [Eurytemora carolleeae]|eukprot:XP_023348164.1 PITH domain-containing protein CG6153-like isoform X2 [Eurytemora affinis]
MPCGQDHEHSEACGHGAAGLAGEEMGIAYSLYQRIDLNQLSCLNEAVEESGKKVFKPYEARLDRREWVESDADEELLFNIPFTGSVKLKGLIILGGEDGTHPKMVRLFKNRPNMSFSDAEGPADQEFNLVKDVDGTIEYQTKIVKFSSVHHLSLHFPTNFGDDSTKIYYIGLSGEWTKADRVGVVNCVYESRPMMEDHKQDLQDGGVASMNGAGGSAF